MGNSYIKIIAFFSLIFLFFSCSNGQDEQGLGITYDNTLRKQFQSRFEGVNWTEELDAELIADRKKLAPNLFSRRSLSTVEAASVISVPDAEKIYPSVAGFGSIDVREIPSSLRTMLTGFCSNLLRVSHDRTRGGLYSALASDILSGRQYMLSIYLYDTAAYPAADRFFLGSPMIQGEYYEIPVLFHSSEGNWIVSLYAVLQEDVWKIEQIRYGEFVYE